MEHSNLQNLKASLTKVYTYFSHKTTYGGSISTTTTPQVVATLFSPPHL
jgi:hypothetical protein